MGPRTKLLVETLGETIALLREHGEEHWSAWLSKSMHCLENADFYGITHLLSAFGGMGSFNELSLHKEGILLIESNDQLHMLKERIYTLAEEIRRSAVL